MQDTLAQLRSIRARLNSENAEALTQELSAQVLACQQHGYMAEFVEVAEALLRHADALSPEIHAELLVHTASFCDEMGWHDTALERLSRARELSSNEKEQLLLRIEFYAFYALIRTERLEDAERCLERMDDLEQVLASRLATSRVYACHGHLQDLRQNFESAQRWHARALQMARDVASPGELLTHFGAFSRLLLRRGLFHEALAFCEEGRDLLEKAETSNVISSLSHHALASFGLGLDEQARQQFLSVLERASAMGLHELCALACTYLAWLDRDREEGRVSQHWLQKGTVHDMQAEGNSFGRLALLRCCLDPRAELPEELQGEELEVTRALAAHRSGDRIVWEPELGEPLWRIVLPELVSDLSSFRLAPDHSWLHVEGHEPLDLSRRAALRRVLSRLVRARAGAVSTVELFEVGWPEVEHAPRNGFRRVYTALHRLKKAGLLIETTEDGYRLPMRPIFETSQDP